MKNYFWLFVALGLCLIAVVILLIGRGTDTNDVALKTDELVSCAAYYEVTANQLQDDQDDDITDQYRERVELALSLAAAISGTSIGELTLNLQERSNLLASSLELNGSDLGTLAVTYDDRCISLLDT